MSFMESVQCSGSIFIQSLLVCVCVCIVHCAVHSALHTQEDNKIWSNGEIGV